MFMVVNTHAITPFATQWSGTFRLGWLIDSFHALLAWKVIHHLH
ncbi:hypothetical protein BIFPSEUDO_03428 [Bifidobacterium pseudocatenulatum DSM 20438 = JCM 1200 = LMG 10505]|uniref:Uncharacterized protein n=1 Tax=Bifidobacterium pseudocatenulatum DSM 20438 = JCM 1200 = LMG 10505 TaxID=547043 RepID=C0BSR2_BIFPS|nr:hypothetical protein BIFPSEUDO_03428 [Bifidobacterium pseudocatenulatum DSM 20438 = JCM 1200 = LMG 10505]